MVEQILANTNNWQNSELCAFCGSPGVKRVHKDKLFGEGANAVVIENLPILQCSVCGENYYDPETSLLIDEILV